MNEPFDRDEGERIRGSLGWVAALYAFSIPLNGLERELWGSTSFAKIIGYAAAAAAATTLVRSSWPRLNAGHWLLFGYSCAITLSILWSSDSDTAVVRAVTQWQLFGQLIFLAIVVRRPSDLKLLCDGYLLGASLAALAVILGPEDSRSTGFRGADANETALMLAIGISMATFGGKEAPIRGRVLRLLFIPIAVWGVVMTGSRGGLMVTTVALSGVFFSLRNRFSRLAMVAASAFAVIVFYSQAEAGAAGPARLLTFHEDLSVGSLEDVRFDIWSVGLDIFLENPILGVGTAGFLVELRNRTGLSFVAHNTYLGILAEQGIIGAVILGGALIVLASRLRFRPSRERILLVTYSVMVAVGAMSLSLEFLKITWLWLGLLALEPANGRPCPSSAIKSSSSERRKHAKDFALRQGCFPAVPDHRYSG